jgi:hypothetical protein
VEPKIAVTHNNVQKMQIVYQELVLINYVLSVLQLEIPFVMVYLVLLVLIVFLELVNPVLANSAIVLLPQIVLCSVMELYVLKAPIVSQILVLIVFVKNVVATVMEIHVHLIVVASRELVTKEIVLNVIMLKLEITVIMQYVVQILIALVELV